MSAPSPARASLAQRLRLLRLRWLMVLVPDLETDFQQRQREAYVPLIRVASVIAFGLLTFYLGADLLGQRRLLHAALLVPAFLFGALPITALTFAMERRKDRGFPLWWVVAPAASNTLCWAVLPAIGHVIGAPWPYEILLFNLIYTFFFLAIPVQLALLITLTAAVLFTLLQVLTARPDWVLFTRGFVVFGFIVHGAAAAAIVQRNERMSWLAQRRLAMLTQRDGLTGLFNRHAFVERVDTALRQARRVQASISLMVLDADHFKQFNDKHGHAAGDACLRRIAGVLEAVPRRPLDCVARLGNERFAVLFFDAPEAWAMARAEEIRYSVQALNRDDLPCATVSIGVAVSLQDLRLDYLLEQAEAALRRIKSSSRNSVGA